MLVIGELGRQGLPRAIPADELEMMLGPSAAFCSWDTSNSRLRELVAGWPFLFSHPLMGTTQEARTPENANAPA